MAANYAITIHKHADFSRTFQVKVDNVVQDLTNYSFAGTLRPNQQSTVTVDFVASIIDAPTGLFKITLTDTATADMKAGDWVYDVVMTDDGGTKTRLLQGVADVLEGATR